MKHVIVLLQNVYKVEVVLMRKVHRGYSIAVVALALLMVTACSSSSNLKAVSSHEASLDDVVLALRLSPQLSDIGSGADEGYLLLAKEDGTADVLNIGSMDTGQVVWEDSGLYFSGPDTEYLLSGSGLTDEPRGSHEEYETIRFPLNDSPGYVSVYNVGFSEDSYQNRVVAAAGERPQSWEVPGLLTSISQCGETVVGITSSKELSLDAQTLVDAPEQSEVLLQLYPQPESFEAGVLAQLDRGDTFVFDQFMESAPCVDGTMYTLAYQSPVSDPEERVPVLRAWNTKSGEHVVIPLISEDGAEAQLTPDYTTSVHGHLSEDGASYRWVQVMDGKVRSVDLTSGVVSELFDVELAQLRGESAFVVTENSVFVLNANEARDPLIFSRYEITTGNKTDYFEIKHLRSIDYFRMPRNVIRGMAINPKWLELHDKG